MNQDLLLDGKNLISASRASQQSGYAMDYIGQLSRGGKIPARMIGRTWYVDYDALLSHKQNKRTRKKNFTESNKIPAPKPVAKAILPAVTSPYASEFKYIPEAKAFLPELHRDKVIDRSGIKSKSNKSVYASGVLILLVAIFSWLNYASPRTAEIVWSDLGQISAQGVTGAQYVFDLEAKHFGLLSAATSNSQNMSGQQGTGLVTFPDPSLHDKAVATVKSAFSDEASISFDKDGTSGIITPVFHPGDDTDHYAFVMVPVKPKQ